MSSRQKRKRKKRAAEAGAAPAAPAPSRSEQRNEAARAALVPLGAGERPAAVTVSAVIAALLGLVNIVLYAAGFEVDGERPQLVGVLGFSGLMLAAAWGMWRVRYWAVLGMQALLALIVLYFFLAATRVSSFVDVLIVTGFIVPSGLLFWHLVKAMARIQMPERRPSR